MSSWSHSKNVSKLFPEIRLYSIFIGQYFHVIYYVYSSPNIEGTVETSKPQFIYVSICVCKMCKLISTCQLLQKKWLHSVAAITFGKQTVTSVTNQWFR